MAAAVVAFVSIGAFVAFSGGLPFLGSDSGTQHVALSAANPAARAAAHAARPATTAVAATPAAPIPAGSPGAIAATTPAGTVTPADPTQPTSPTEPGSTVPPTGGSGTGTTPTGTSQPGVLGGTVSGVDNTTSSLGVDTGLSGATQPVTSQVDSTTRDGLNGVGGALGNPQLGDSTTNAIDGLTGGLLGGG